MGRRKGEEGEGCDREEEVREEGQDFVSTITVFDMVGLGFLQMA